MNSAMLSVLNYHGIQERENEYPWTDGEKPYVVSKVNFRRQLEAISGGKFLSLPVRELDQWILGRDHHSKIMITFDDGHISHYEHAAPFLGEFKFPAIFFISVALIGQKGSMNWPQLKQLHSKGFEIGSHGLNHVPLTYLSAHELDKELKGSKTVLEDGLGVEIKTFSVPRGFYNGRVRRAAEQAGYRYIFTSRFDVNRLKHDPLSLARLAVKSSTTANEFEKMLKGELGFQWPAENLKELARSTVPPNFYEFASNTKRVVCNG